MAPTPTPTILVRASSNHSSGKYRRLHRQGLSFFRRPPRRPSPSRAEHPKVRSLDTTLQPSIILEGPLPPPTSPTSSELVVLAPETSTIAIPVRSSQPQGLNQNNDIPGNIVAAIVVVVLILGGLIGLVVGGEILRRRVRTTGKGASPPPSRHSGHRKSRVAKSAAGSPHQRTKTARGKFPYDERTLTPLSRPPPAFNRERQRRLSDVWPIRSLSMAVCNRRSCPEQVEGGIQCSPTAKPQTTWSEFSLVSSYVAPPRTVLACIPEELEDCQSQTSGDIAAFLGDTLQRSVKSGSVVWANESESSRDVMPIGLDGLESLVAIGRRGPRDYQFVCKAETRDEDARSLGSVAPDMTSDRDDSSGSSTASLESFGGGSDRESLGEEVFELKRAQTRSMQMNKGVLLSLGLKSLDGEQDSGSMHGESGPSRSPSAPDAGSKVGVEGELSLVTLGEDFSAVDLDEFSSPPSILPMIPSFVSTF